MAHNRLCIYIIHYVQFIILGENPGIWKLWTDYGHYELPEPLMDAGAAGPALRCRFAPPGRTVSPVAAACV